MRFNETYLNRTPNKTERNTNTYTPLFVVWHETAGGGSLEWCLRASVEASFNYLIDSKGTIWHYVNEKEYIAWHAGVQSSAIVNSITYTLGQINEASIGVEIEGPNNGSPINALQRDAALALLGYFNREYNIPVTEEYHRGHKAITSNGYKSDPRGYSVKRLIDLYAARIPQIPSISFDTFYTYGDMQPRAVYNALIAAGKDPGLEICNGDIAQLKLLQKFEAELPTDTTHIYPPLKDYWEASGGLWQSDRYALGYAKVRPKRNADGTIEQVFERGILELYPDGTIQGRLLY